MYSAPYSLAIQYQPSPFQQQQQQQQLQMQQQQLRMQQQQPQGVAPTEYFQQSQEPVQSQPAPIYSHPFVHTNPYLHVQPQAPTLAHMEPYHGFRAPYMGYGMGEDLVPPPPPTPPTPMATADDRVSRVVMLSLLPSPEQLPDSVLAQEIEKTWGPLRYLDLS
ncbi:hypothetical protein CLOP_g14749, partial [Closterium sp. NIES-67]